MVVGLGRLLVSCVVLLAMIATGVCANLEESKSWTGKVRDDELKKLAPESGFISDAAVWQKLWAAWRPGEALPPIDFKQALILVATVEGPNQIMMRPSLEANGDVRFVVAGTRMAGPGFGYKLIQVQRDGVLSVNGTRLTEGKRSEPNLIATVGRPEARVDVLVEGGRTIVEARSASGIGSANIQRARVWPPGILVRLYSSGLESFRVRAGDVAVQWSVSSSGNHVARVSLIKDGKTMPLAATDPFFSKVRIEADVRTIPLENGYFEIALPDELFEDDPEQISLRWIDFYRN